MRKYVVLHKLLNTTEHWLNVFSYMNIISVDLMVQSNQDSNNFHTAFNRVATGYRHLTLHKIFQKSSEDFYYSKSIAYSIYNILYYKFFNYDNSSFLYHESEKTKFNKQSGSLYVELNFMSILLFLLHYYHTNMKLISASHRPMYR